MAIADKGFIYEKHGDWLFSWYTKAPGVIIAETKVKGYNEEWLDIVEKELRLRKYRPFIDRTDNQTYKENKKKTTIEIYKKYNEGTISENIQKMLVDFEEVFSMETEEFIPDIPDAPKNPQW